MMRLWLALDVGTTGAKAALLDENGGVVRSAYRTYMTSTGDGTLEQDARDWWAAVVDATRELNAGAVNAIALTGQMQDMILLDGQGEPIRPVLLYSDTRAWREAEALNAQFGAERLRAITGNGQDGSSLLAKLHWLRTHEPDTFRRSARLLIGAADYIALRMTGTASTDTTTASTTGLLDIGTRAYLAPDILAELGLSDAARLLPAVHAGGAQDGWLTSEAAEVLHLPPGIPVHHGPGDAGATTFGAGSGEPGRAYGYIGTSGWVAFTSETRIASENTVFTLAHARSDYLITIAPLLTAGGNLDWVRALFEVESHADLIGEALGRPPSGLLYLPYLNGERFPFSDPFARGAFIGLSANHRRADLCRAVLEGVVYAYRHAIDILGEQPAALTLTGGGTRSRGWSQLVADVTGLHVSLVNDPANVGLRGAVLAARVARGELAGYALADEPGEFLHPDITHHAHYARQYVLFRHAYPALKSLFAEMARSSA